MRDSRDQQRAGVTRRLLQMGLAALVLAGAVAAWGLAGDTEVHASALAEPATAATPATVPATFADVAAAVQPAVVDVAVSGAAPTRVGPPGGQTPQLEDFLRRFFGDRMPDRRETPRQRPFQGTGSGFLVDPTGLVVTNWHVVEHADLIEVRMSDGTIHEAMLRGADPKTDLALLKIEAGESLPHVAFGDSDALRVGDWVVAVGNPFGLGPSVSTGVVSARGRDIHSGPYDDFIQTDAPINRGNSGGPLFDLQGRVVGVNTAIYSPNGGSVGIGFAIPAKMVERIVEDLRDDGRVERGWLGVQIQGLDEDLADALGLESPDGALVASVSDDSPAAEAGLQGGDVIVAVNDEPVESPRDLSRRVAHAGPGTEVRLGVIRDGERLDMRVSLEALAETVPTAVQQPEDDQARLGMRIAPLSDELRRRARLPEDVQGVIVAEVDPAGPAARKGLRPGDVILRAGDRAVEAPTDLAAAVHDAVEAGRKAVSLQIWRNGGRAFVAVSVQDGTER